RHEAPAPGPLGRNDGGRGLQVDSAAGKPAFSFVLSLRRSPMPASRVHRRRMATAPTEVTTRTQGARTDENEVSLLRSKPSEANLTMDTNPRPWIRPLTVGLLL